jgi:hypothetical protein
VTPHDEAFLVNLKRLIRGSIVTAIVFTSNQASADEMLKWNSMAGIPLVSYEKVNRFRIQSKLNPTVAVDWDQELSMVWSTAALQTAAVVDPRYKDLQPEDVIRARVEEYLGTLETDERNDVNPMSIGDMLRTTLHPLTTQSSTQSGCLLVTVENEEEDRGSRFCNYPACLIM